METAQAKILIVEDDPQIRMMLQKFLSKHGFQIVLADDGLKGVKSFNEEHPNLVLLDTLLPKLMGFDVCDMIKGSPEGKSTPVVMMSAVCRAEKFQTEAKSKHRADHFLVKPFQFSEMISVIEGLLGQSKETLTMPAATMPTRPPPVGPHSRPRPAAYQTIVSGPASTFVASPPPLPSSANTPPPFAGTRQVSFPEAPPAHDVLDIIDTAEETTDPIELDQSELTPVNVKAPHAASPDDFEIPAAEASPPDTVIVEFETDNSDEETSLTPPPTAPRRGPEVEIEFTPAPAPAPAQFVNPPPAPTFTGDVRYGLSRPERPTESLGAQPLAALFQTLGAQGFSGALEVTHDDTTRRVFWQGGQVAFVEPLSRSENVGRFLVKSGKIADADYSRALEAMMDSAGSMEDALVASGAVAAADLPAMVNDAVRDRAMSLFAWRESTFQTTPEATPPPGSPDAALDPVVLAFHALCRQLPDDWVTAKLATIRSKHVTPTEAFDQMSPRLDALQIPAAITDGLGKLTVAQIAGADPNNAPALFRCLRAMIEFGWVAVETSIPASPEESFELTATPAPSPTPAAPAPTAATAPETAEAFFRRGEKLLKEGAFATALVAFTNALKANPKEPEYYLYLGWAMYQNYRGSGRADMETRAINFVRRALVMNPNFDQGYFILGRIYQEKGKPDQAKQLYAKTIFINPSHGEALAAMRTLPK